MRNTRGSPNTVQTAIDAGYCFHNNVDTSADCAALNHRGVGVRKSTTITFDMII